MNIQQAKEEIKRSLIAYHTRDENGCYVYPNWQQRPILLMGPPGIGKSAIMQQIAEECHVGLVSYTMTHHTRQSAIGLPRIIQKNILGEEVLMTEYTLSEMIASIYNCMETQHLYEGILFIDEINCVSETLTPVMLQFLQSKMFGTHKIPDGWMIVAAGNPGQYNRSAKEFDIVTMDRVRHIEIEPDLDIWLRYAAARKVHPSVLTFLKVHPENFFAANARGAERKFVTPRGWEDLSTLMRAYENMDAHITDEQMLQFLGDEHIAREFASYYRIYRKYGIDYGIDEILQGSFSADMYKQRIAMAKAASFEERYTLIGLLLGGIGRELSVERKKEEKRQVLQDKKDVAVRVLKEGESLEHLADTIEEALAIKLRQETAGRGEERQQRMAAALLRKIGEKIRMQHLYHCDEKRHLYLKTMESYQNETKQQQEKVGEILKRAFRFVEEGFETQQEMFLFVTMLSSNPDAMAHISEAGSEEFVRWSRQLQL